MRKLALLAGMMGLLATSYKIEPDPVSEHRKRKTTASAPQDPPTRQQRRAAVRREAKK